MIVWPVPLACPLGMMSLNKGRKVTLAWKALYTAERSGCQVCLRPHGKDRNSEEYPPSLSLYPFLGP